MLPIPTKDYLPRNLRDLYDSSPEAIALCDKMDDLFTEWKDESIEIAYCKDPVRTPFQFLDEMNQYLEADFLAGDTETIKRKKLAQAIDFHKTRGTWVANVKKVCDTYTGLSAQLINSDYLGFAEDFIMVGTADTYLSTPSYGILIGNTTAPPYPYGMPLIGEGTEEINAGVVWIDLGYGIEDIVGLKDIIPERSDIGPVAYEPLMSSIGYHASGYGMDITEGGILTSYSTAVDSLIKSLIPYVPAYMRVFIVYPYGDYYKIYAEVV